MNEKILIYFFKGRWVGYVDKCDTMSHYVSEKNQYDFFFFLFSHQHNKVGKKIASVACCYAFIFFSRFYCNG